MRKRHLLSLLVGISCVFAVQASQFTLYLTRHAEKQTIGENPGLTACGHQRANELATLLHKVPLQAVYSTAYQRTMQTATPTAKQQHIAVKLYSPKYLAQLALQLKQAEQNALIVGHSNTTITLLELLTQQTFAAMAENEYQALYQLQFINDHVTVTELTQPLNCQSQPLQ
jgi:phosphohistidine phosphatase SixA